MINRQQCAENCFDAIMSLSGSEAFKKMVGRLRKFQQNKEEYSVSDVVTLPNYLWVAKRGSGISTRAHLFAEYLYTAKIIEFSGIVKHFEFKLDYMAPDTFFSELARLNSTISEIAGHHRYYRGLALINIDEWLGHTNEKYFLKFLDYISSKNEKILAIFYVHTDDKREVESIESSLSSHIRFESVWFRFPDAAELIEIIDADYFKQQGFFLAGDAKSLLKDSIEEIINGKHFNGFMTIRQLANDILYSLLTSEISSNNISAALLSDFSRDSSYIKRIKTFVGNRRAIGFNTSLEDFSK